MKKKVMLFLMAIMMSFSAMCYASYGSDLDAETKIVDQFVYQVFSDGHVLVYAAKFEKGAVMELDVAFKVTNGKFSIMNFRVVDPNAQAPAENNAAKK